jgi:SAM-dependent methyltransferase
MAPTTPPADAPQREEPAAGGGGALAPFDSLAAGYDATFSRSTIGRLMREAVWRRLDLCFAPGERVIELGCGTGEDATHLARRGVRVLATDSSAPMLAAARRKIESAGLAGAVEVRRLAIEDLAAAMVPAAAMAPWRQGLHYGDSLPLAPPFDGALSNFGALNCVADLAAAAAGLAACVRPGGVAVLCLMGPLVPWEWAWFLRRGQPGQALRRLRPGGAPWRGLTVHYPTIGRLRRLLAPAFRLRRAAAIGALLPPSYAEPWAVRHLQLVRRLARYERRCETWVPLPWLADHYLVEMVRQ